jgi:hypothetical protein
MPAIKDFSPPAGGSRGDNAGNLPREKTAGEGKLRQGDVDETRDDSSNFFED